jgi:organic hydroperoxide reductase OsmC/OhrA
MCLLTTFEAFAARDRVEVSAWDARVTGTVDKTPHGLRFTAFTVEVEMEVDDIVRAKAALASAEHHCLVSHALNTQVAIIANARSPRSREPGGRMPGKAPG